MKTCCICAKENSSYKCPTCKTPYCSAACCKSHKAKECRPIVAESPENESPNDAEAQYEFPTEDTVPLEKLQLLRNSDQVKTCLANRHVRSIVDAVLNDPDPTRAIGIAMTEPIFVELADACLKVVEPPEVAETL